jgi:FkbM family methyltransferase
MKDFEQCVRRVYEAVLLPGQRAVDIGAHTGGHTFPMAHAVTSGGRIDAIEPLPQCCQSLTNQHQQRPNNFSEIITVHQMALSHYQGQADFVVTIDTPGFSGLKERVYDNPTRLDRIPVRVDTFDRLFLDWPSLAYVKLDAEGGEYHILRGAAESIDKFRPLVTCEFGVNSISEYDITPLDMAEFWFARDYKLFDINGRWLETPEVFNESAHLQHVWDYVAIPAQRTDLAATVCGILAD